MRFKIHVKNEDGDWWEEYDEKTHDAMAWAEKTVEKFNNTLKAREKPRTLIKVEVLNKNKRSGESYR